MHLPWTGMSRQAIYLPSLLPDSANLAVVSVTSHDDVYIASNQALYRLKPPFTASEKVHAFALPGPAWTRLFRTPYVVECILEEARLLITHMQNQSTYSLNLGVPKGFPSFVMRPYALEWLESEQLDTAASPSFIVTVHYEGMGVRCFDVQIAKEVFRREEEWQNTWWYLAFSTYSS